MARARWVLRKFEAGDRVVPSARMPGWVASTLGKGPFVVTRPAELPTDWLSAECDGQVIAGPEGDFDRFEGTTTLTATEFAAASNVHLSTAVDASLDATTVWGWGPVYFDSRDRVDLVFQDGLRRLRDAVADGADRRRLVTTLRERGYSLLGPAPRSPVLRCFPGDVVELVAPHASPQDVAAEQARRGLDLVGRALEGAAVAGELVVLRSRTTYDREQVVGRPGEAKILAAACGLVLGLLDAVERLYGGSREFSDAVEAACGHSSSASLVQGDYRSADDEAERLLAALAPTARRLDRDRLEGEDDLPLGERRGDGLAEWVALRRVS